jgi:hypothetical protein
MTSSMAYVCLILLSYHAAVGQQRGTVLSGRPALSRCLASGQ